MLELGMPQAREAGSTARADNLLCFMP